MKARIKKIVQKYGGDKSFLVPILQDLQKEWNYLPKDVLKTLSTVIDVPISRIYEVATFYKAFSLTPRGKHNLMLCVGTACHVRGAALLGGHIERSLCIKDGGTTPDKEFTFETVNCLGACALGPVVVIDGHYFPQVKIGNVKKIIDTAKIGFDAIEGPNDQRIFPVDVSCPRCNHSLIDREHLIDGFPTIRLTASFGKLHGWLR